MGYFNREDGPNWGRSQNFNSNSNEASIQESIIRSTQYQLYLAARDELSETFRELQEVCDKEYKNAVSYAQSGLTEREKSMYKLINPYDEYHSKEELSLMDRVNEKFNSYQPYIDAMEAYEAAQIHEEDFREEAERRYFEWRKQEESNNMVNETNKEASYVHIPNIEVLAETNHRFSEESIDSESVDQSQNIVNLTPHAITICNEAGEVVDTIEASGTVARVSSTSSPSGTLRGYPAVRTEYGDVTGLEEEQPGVVYLVSAMVGQVLAGKRNDIYSPDTGPTACRSENGQIKGVKQFIKW